MKDHYKDHLEFLRRVIIKKFEDANKRHATWHDITPIEDPWEKKYWLLLKDILDRVDSYIKSTPPKRSGREVVLDAMAFSEMTEFLDPKSAVSKYRNEMDTDEFETLGIVLLSVRKAGDEIYLDVSGSTFTQEQKLAVIESAKEVIERNGGKYN